MRVIIMAVSALYSYKRQLTGFHSGHDTWWPKGQLSSPAGQVSGQVSQEAWGSSGNPFAAQDPQR